MHYQVLKDSLGKRYNSFKEILPRFEPLGTGIRSTNEISSLTSFNFPTRDVIVTLETNSFKSQWLQFVRTADFEGYETRIEVGRDFMIPNKFGRPEDAAVDNANNVYIADSQKDSVFIFNSFGDELQSFGGTEIFDSPHSVAFFDKTLYVLDTNNGRIVRFILSTEIE
jgi:sugar lactone lactonase YvrE